MITIIIAPVWYVQCNQDVTEAVSKFRSEKLQISFFSEAKTSVHYLQSSLQVFFSRKIVKLCQKNESSWSWFCEIQGNRRKSSWKAGGSCSTEQSTSKFRGKCDWFLKNNHGEQINTKNDTKSTKDARKIRRRKNRWKYMTGLDKIIAESRSIKYAKGTKKETKIQTMEHKSRIL